MVRCNRLEGWAASRGWSGLLGGTGPSAACGGLGWGAVEDAGGGTWLVALALVLGLSSSWVSVRGWQRLGGVRGDVGHQGVGGPGGQQPLWLRGLQVSPSGAD